MIITKILNNNVVMSNSSDNREIVLMGKGLAFQKKIGDCIDKSKIEKYFILGNQNIGNKLEELMQETSEVYLNLAHKILELAKSKISYKLDDYLYVALTDHLSFAVARHKNGIDLKNPLLWEIRKIYNNEFEIAQQALTIIEDELNISLGEDEAASIALHLVNSQISGENMQHAVQVTEIVQTILNIVKYFFKIKLDENSVNYERFITHLRYFAIRYIREETHEENTDNMLYEQIKIKYSDAYKCTKRVASYLYKIYNWEISKDEITFLTLHIHRVTIRTSS